MCVIIYIPKGESISEKEIKDAWDTNPHGAGYSIQKDGKVHFKRGFMNVKTFYEEIKPLIKNYNLLLHFRISTSKSINKTQTHPYKKSDIMTTQGITSKPVICMNGVISGQKEYLECNDTMSYIIDHQDAFANINQDILNIIEEATGAKWAVMTPDKTLLSSKFELYEGRYYSNKNHLISYYYTYGYNYKNRNRKKYSLEKLIKNQKLIKSIKKDDDLYDDLLDFVAYWCNFDSCRYCTKCLKNAKTLRDVKITLNENYYYGSDDPYNYDDNDTCTLDFNYDDNDTCALDFNYNNDELDFDYENENYYANGIYYIDGKRMTEEEYLNYIDLLY